MSKPIKLTDELLEKIKEEFVAKVKSTKMFDGKLEYSREFKWDGEDDRATVYLSSIAFAKMNALIQQFSDEVAWHGVVHRKSENEAIFYIEDILVYPQIITSTTVNTDQDAYQNWLYSFDDDVFNHIRMQGHSHVNMGVSPSGVDTTHQEKILQQISDDDFYIFMIWNKRYDHFVRIFDLKNNTLYDTADVDVFIGDTGVDLQAFLDNAKEIVVKKTYTPPATSWTGSYDYTAYRRQTPSAADVADTKGSAPANAHQPVVKTKPKESKETGIGRSFQEYKGFGDPDEPPYDQIYLRQ